MPAGVKRFTFDHRLDGHLTDLRNRDSGDNESVSLHHDHHLREEIDGQGLDVLGLNSDFASFLHFDLVPWADQVGQALSNCLEQLCQGIRRSRQAYVSRVIECLTMFRHTGLRYYYIPAASGILQL